MAGSLNRVFLIGRTTKDPVLKSFPNGGMVCNFSMATNRYGRDPESGESKEFTDFHDLVAWNQAGNGRKLADLCGSLKKGSLAFIEGRLQSRSWDDVASGQKRYKTEVNVSDIQFLEAKRDGTGAPAPAVPPAVADVFPDALPSGSEAPTDPDDIPF